MMVSIIYINKMYIDREREATVYSKSPASAGTHLSMKSQIKASLRIIKKQSYCTSFIDL